MMSYSWKTSYFLFGVADIQFHWGTFVQSIQTSARHTSVHSWWNMVRLGGCGCFSIFSALSLSLLYLLILTLPVFSMFIGHSSSFFFLLFWLGLSLHYTRFSLLTPPLHWDWSLPPQSASLTLKCTPPLHFLHSCFLHPLSCSHCARAGGSLLTKSSLCSLHPSTLFILLDSGDVNMFMSLLAPFKMG